MPASGADLYGLQSFARVSGAGGVAHAHRNSRIAAGVVAELATVVVSPGVGVSVAAHRQRMRASGADLHVGEIRWQVRIRLGIRLPDHDRYSPSSGRPVAQLAIVVESPGVGVPVATHRQGKTIEVFCPADLVKSDASAVAVRRGDGGGFAAKLAALVWADLPCVVPAFGRPLGGQGQVLVNGLAEVVGHVADEPSVELVAFARRIGGGPLHPAVRGRDLLVSWFGVSAVCVERDRVGGVWLRVSGQRSVDRVLEASGEGLVVLPAGDEDGGWPRLTGEDLRLPGVVDLAELE